MSFKKEAQSVGILLLRILSDIAEEVTAVGVGGNGVLSLTNAGLVVKKHVKNFECFTASLSFAWSLLSTKVSKVTILPKY